MPTDKPKHNKPQSPKKPVPDSQSNAVHVVSPQSGEEHTRSGQSAPDEQNPNNPRVSDIQQVDVIEAVDANKIARTANNISRWSVVVNALIFAVTASLAIVAVRQYKAANDAALTAQNTFKETKRFDSITLVNQKVQSDSTDSLNKRSEKRQNKTFEIQDSSLNAQITSLNNTQNNFEKSNRAYLEAAEFNPVYNNKKELVAIGFNIVNKGSQPAKIISAYYSGRMGNPGITDTGAIKQSKAKRWEKYSDYVSIYAPDKKTIVITPIVDTFRVKEMVMGVKNEYIYSESIYINLVTNKKTLYKFIAEINLQNAQVNYRFIQNDNIPLKN